MSEKPTPKNMAVSRQMSRMPREDTGPEMAIRRLLHASGLRYRVNYRELPGSPDIALTRAEVAVFIDGCFWHGCPDHGTLPKNNQEWWRRKLERNRERDAEKDAELRERGWRPVHFWEHEDPVTAAEKIIDLWRRRTGRVGQD